MDCSVHAATTSERRIGSVDQGIGLEGADVACRERKDTVPDEELAHRVGLFAGYGPVTITSWGGFVPASLLEYVPLWLAAALIAKL